jgi:hypothetical protein
MALSWNEIKKRALEFSEEYKDATKENAETQSFYNDFFNVFGISRRRVASFEEPVKKLGDKKGRVDLFWKGMLLIEQKSSGKDLSKAKEQALSYFPNLKEYELPKYVLVSDFQNFELFDLEENIEVKFKLSELHKNVNHFGFIAGYTKRKFEDQAPVNIKAGELIADLHDKLVENGYTGHELEQFLIRLLFCLFADDSGIFERDIFKFYVEERTQEDGNDLGGHIERIFQVLNKPRDSRQKNIDEDLDRFPYVNGELFEGYLPHVQFDSSMREQLIKCCNFNWSNISPAIFGAIFQSAMNQEQRRNLGAHYTSEKNIMKLIKPLFLDELYDEFEKVKSNKNKLQEFHNKISNLKFLDPACGCGNFLIIAYRELRELEIKVLKSLLGEASELDAFTDLSNFTKVNIEQFYGIEIEELPAKIAEVALWLVDHQMNLKLSETFGKYFARIPLTKTKNIWHANALRVDWEELVYKEELNYILGNPPFVGKQYQTKDQKEDLASIFKGVKGSGVMDFVACWHIKSAQYIQNTKIKVAFVSTNSIAQGEQVGILWNELFNNYKTKIHFAHRTFSWSNEARGKAAVHVVIIGFANFDSDKKHIYEYENINSEPHEILVGNINPYLVEGNDYFLLKRNKPLSGSNRMSKGSMPNDGGYLLLSRKEKEEIVNKDISSGNFIKKFIGAQEFINNVDRFCFWLLNAKPIEINNCSEIKFRVEKVKEYRLKSNRSATKKGANTPYLFGEIRQPESHYIAFPEVSSGARKYIPIGYFDKQVIASNKLYTISDASIFSFGVLTSIMHNCWIKYVSGRMKSDIQYSTGVVYNNFPWPKNPTDKQIKTIEEKAQAVLDVRKLYPDSSLADLYNPLTMPKELVKAHNELDKAVDLSYRKAVFKDERERIEFLFNLYQEYLEEEKK